MQITTISTNGFSFLGKEEGVRLKPYLDSRGIPTIAIGCTFYEDKTPVKMTDPEITMLRAISLTQTVLKQFEDAVVFGVKANIGQPQFDALVSMCYNIGGHGFLSSTLLKTINAENATSDLIVRGFTGWSSGGVLLPRRLRESALFLQASINDVINIFKISGGTLTSEQLNHLTNF